MRYAWWDDCRDERPLPGRRSHCSGRYSNEIGDRPASPFGSAPSVFGRRTGGDVVRSRQVVVGNRFKIDRGIRSVGFADLIRGLIERRTYVEVRTLNYPITYTRRIFRIPSY